MRRLSKEFGVLLLLAGVFTLGSVWWFWPITADTGEITLTEARRQQPLWIDARSAAEYEAAHIPGARLLNPANWESDIPGILEAWTPPGRSAVVYCAAPDAAASREIAERLRAFQLGPVFRLQGGWKAWETQ